MIDAWLQSLSELFRESVWLAPFLAFLAGVLTSFTPSSLSAIPLIVGYMGGTGQRSTKRAFGLSMIFVLGSAITFTILGAVASLAGGMISAAGNWWYLILGVLMVLMALQTFEVFTFIPATYLVSKNKKRGWLGALVAGFLGGIFSSPCSTPMLVVLLAVVAGGGNLLWGIFLLLLYAIGNGTLAVVAGTSVGFVQKLSLSGSYGKVSRILQMITGVLILALGLYFLYLGF